MRQPTIYEVLWKKLGRRPTNKECIEEVKRILKESAEEIAQRKGRRK